MIYSNDDPMAILAMEIARTDNYGEYDSYDGETVCPYAVLLNRNIIISMMMKNVSAAVNVSESRTLCIDEKSILNEKEGD